MALIKCVECGKEISDKAQNCTGCGCPVENSIIIKCPECNQETTRQHKSCPNCGFVFGKSIYASIKKNGNDNQGKKKIKLKKKNIITLIIVSIILVVVAIVSGFFINRNNTINEYLQKAEKAIRECDAEKAYEYYDKILEIDANNKKALSKIEYLDGYVVQHDKELATALRLACLGALMDPDVIMYSKHDSLLFALECSIGDIRWMHHGTAYTEFVKYLCEKMHVDSLDEISDQIMSPKASGEISLTLTSDGNIIVEIDGTDIKAE